MTIFDTIRYPVSDKPTIEELQRIPEPIIQMWRDNTMWREHGTVSPAGMSAWYWRPRTQEHVRTEDAIAADKAEVAFLRRLIAKWDDDDYL